MIVHPVELIRRELKLMVYDASQLVNSGEASTASEALDQISNTKPDLLLCALTLGASTGIELATFVRIRCPQIRILLISDHASYNHAAEAEAAGANAFLDMNELYTKGIDTIYSLLVHA